MVEIPPKNGSNLRANSIKRRQHISERIAQTFPKASTRYSNIFLSLGDDYESPDHIIPYNLYWKSRRRTRRLPSDLVIITNGFMDEDFWCLVRPPLPCSAADLSVEYWSPAPLSDPKENLRGPRYESFPAFLEMLIAYYKQRIESV